MTVRILIVILFLFAINTRAQTGVRATENLKADVQKNQDDDKLLKHLSAAETYQISGDLVNASIENRNVLAIALERSGNVAIEEGKYPEAIKIFTKSLTLEDNAATRTNLAIAYLRQNQVDKALAEAQAAALIDPDYLGAHYILGNIYFNKQNFEAALPELEKALLGAPDFGIAHSLALTYLQLKQIDRAKLLFDEIRISAGKESVDLHLLFARDYERTNYPDEAELELKRARTLDPNKLKVNFYLGYLLLQNGGSERMREAGDAFDKELKLNPNDFYSLFFKGVVASSEDMHAEAIPYLKRAVALNPDSGLAHLYLGKSQIETNDMAAAEKSLRRAVELESTDEKGRFQARRTHFLLGRLLLKTGRKEEGAKELTLAGKLQQESLDTARSEIEEILGQVADRNDPQSGEESMLGSSAAKEVTPERALQLSKIKLYLDEIIAQSYSNLGVIAVQKSQLEDAIENFSSAMEWKEDFPNVRRNLGIVSFRAQKFDRAIGPLSVHLSKNQQDQLVRKLLGASYYFTKEYSRAVETLKPLESVISGDAELAYFYGLSLIHVSERSEAISLFDKLARSSQQDASSLIYAGQGFMTLGEYARAANEFKTVIALAPETPKANYYMGQSLIRLNKFNEAEKSFGRELELSPRDELSKYHLALTLIERKIETEKAIALLNEAIDLRYDYADARYQLGKIFLEKGLAQPAIEQLEIAVSQDETKDYIHYQLSIAYRKVSRLKDAERALKVYEKLKAEKRKTDLPMPMGGVDDSQK